MTVAGIVSLRRALGGLIGIPGYMEPVDINGVLEESVAAFYLVEQMNGTISAKYEAGRLQIHILFPK